MLLRTTAFALGLSACAPAAAPPADAPIAIERESISYATQPCFGACPVYRVTVSPDGEGVFEGERNVVATGTKRFAVDAATYRRFADHLAAVRPASGDRNISQGEPECGIAPTDMPGIAVTWSSNTGAADQTLRLYLGCNSAEAERVKGVLRAAPALLPIGGFIGNVEPARYQP